LASGTSEQTRRLVDYDVLPELIFLTSSENLMVCEQATWALSNVAGDCFMARKCVADAGIIDALVALFDRVSAMPESLMENIAWAISNVCRPKPESLPFEMLKRFLPVLSRLIRSSNEEVLLNSVWAISYLANDDTEDNIRINAVINSDLGICPMLVELLVRKQNSKMTKALLRTIGEIITGNDEHAESIVSCTAFLPRLLQLIVSSNSGIRKEVCWTLSNLMAGTVTQIQRVIDCGFVPIIVSIMKKDIFDVQKEVVYAITRAITHKANTSQINSMVSMDCVSALCELLSCHDVDIICDILDTLDILLRFSAVAKSQVEKCGGLEGLEELQKHENEIIFKKATTIIVKFFESSDEAIAPIVPTVPVGTMFSFK
jgi:importin subunit alpha-1